MASIWDVPLKTAGFCLVRKGFTGLCQILPGFYWVLSSFNGLYWVLRVFCWVLPSSNGFYRVLLGFYWVLPSDNGFDRVLVAFMGRPFQQLMDIVGAFLLGVGYRKWRRIFG